MTRQLAKGRSASMAIATKLEIEPLTPSIGPEVRGVDLAGGLDDDTVAALRSALLEHLVLFFRDQPMTVEQHLALARRFGDVDMPPFRSIGDTPPEVTVLDQRAPRGEGADSWHADY